MLAILCLCDDQFTSSVGNLHIQYNPALRTFGNAFMALQTVAVNLYIHVNAQLTSIGGSFGSLPRRGISAMQFSSNGATTYTNTAPGRVFCASARVRLCPGAARLLQTGWTFGSEHCCAAYCATRSDC